MENELNISLSDLGALLNERAGKERLMVAIIGPPGAGKSTCAEHLVTTINATCDGRAAIFPMDGYHFDDAVLEARGLLSRKGAPDTFDVGGLHNMLQRLRLNEEEEIAVPVFDRTLEIARAGARIIPRDVGLLIVEGNYLLLDSPPWSTLRSLFDISVSIRVDEDELRRRLMERWRSHGIEPEEILAKVEANDLPNGLMVLEQSFDTNYVISN